MPITVERVTSSECAIIDALFRIKFAEDGANQDPEALAKWARWIDGYFANANSIPLVARAGDEVLAFAVAQLGAMSTGADGRTPMETNFVEEFYVLPLHRRKGIGTALADTMFRRYPGRWMATTWPDGMGVGFWRHVATGRSGVQGQRYAPDEYKGFPGQYVWVVESK